MKKKESWIHNKWRPAMAWSYLIICVFDFMVGPIFYSALFASKEDFIQWMPLTTKGGGIYHAAMLTILGVTAWGRTQEKLKMFRPDSNPYDGYDDSGEVEVERETQTIQSIPQNNDQSYERESDEDMAKPMKKKPKK